MTIDRSLWAEIFDVSHFPTFPCPRCNRGRLSFDMATLRQDEPPYSKAATKMDGWEPDWSIERFSAHLRCAEPTCGEIVVISGNVDWTESLNQEHGWCYTSVLHPRMMLPSPPIITLPNETPSKIEERIVMAFGLFWLDIGASANCLRMSVEFLLDHLTIPRTIISQKNGKTLDLDLNGRIQHFEANNSAHGSTFHALRMVGNVGSHGTSITREALLDAFEIYEDALAEIIGGRSAYVEKIKKKILDSKGKY
jgi:hypothetical protein